MKLLSAGMVLFAVGHAFPAAAAGMRKRLIERMGENAYKGAFALLILASVVMMVFGWKATAATEAYVAPEWGRMVALVLAFAAAVLFFAPYMASSVRRFVRHPQLTGVALFGIGHLAAVGSVRSLVLFGGLAVWAMVEMPLLNRRDGIWEKPEAAPGVANLKLVLAGLGLYLLLLFTHEGLFGVTPLPS
jgi:uncharacterized membrane protein